MNFSLVTGKVVVVDEADEIEGAEDDEDDDEEPTWDRGFEKPETETDRERVQSFEYQPNNPRVDWNLDALI